MHLAQASAGLLCGRQVYEEDQRQLQYADMLIKVSQNQGSTWCQEVERIYEIHDQNQSSYRQRRMTLVVSKWIHF